MEVLRLLYAGSENCSGLNALLEALTSRVNAAIGQSTDLSPSVAFRIFPIAHAYNMWGVLQRCTKAALKGLKQEDKTAPDLFQWLAAADVRHYAPMVTACLERLREQPSSRSVIDEYTGGSGSKPTPAALDEAHASRSAIRHTLCNKEHRRLLEGLKQETTLDLVGVMSGMPPGYKVRLDCSSLVTPSL